MNKKRISIIITILAVIAIVVILLPENNKNNTSSNYTINLTDLTYKSDNKNIKLKIYTQEEYNSFLKDYKSHKLPDIYITEFLFDGVSMYKTYDLDDFKESGNDIEVETLKITNLNINTTGKIELTGNLQNGMISVNTNNKKDKINIILNGIKIDTNSKKVPALLVYNKDITNTDCKVTIETKENTKNYLEGGKLKKISLIGSDELESYKNYYTDDYTKYLNYYGVYNKSEIDNILFAKIQADNEDLKDGDPYYFYKGAGAISSDIDLYFKGNGYLEVTSKNKEGIETKGNLTFEGSKGDYVINAKDDCLNTTTKSQNNSARNTLTIDVNSLTAIVDASDDTEEGDGIDSNGKLIINNGTIISLAHPGQDAGLDSEDGIYINGGTVLATGNMYDQISNESKQNFLVLSFKEQIDSLLTILDSNFQPFLAYLTDRTYTNLVYSSSNLVNGTYYLYKGGKIEGTEQNGIYSNITSYTKGTQLGYSITGELKENRNDIPRDMNNEMPPNNEMPFDKERPNDIKEPDNNMLPPEIDNNENTDNLECIINSNSSNFSGIGK